MARYVGAGDAYCLGCGSFSFQGSHPLLGVWKWTAIIGCLTMLKLIRNYIVRPSSRTSGRGYPPDILITLTE